MRDKALGKTRAERALGEAHPKVTRATEFKYAHTGQYDGPKASYGRYNVSEQSADILNRSRRNMDMR